MISLYSGLCSCVFIITTLLVLLLVEASLLYSYRASLAMSYFALSLGEIDEYLENLDERESLAPKEALVVSGTRKDREEAKARWDR